jgi:ubiquinone/menaquinone biosynthesis C-methylase UbiE
MLNYFNKIYLHQLFSPSIISVFINPFYFIRKRLSEKIKIFAPAMEGKLLDFGCGAKPYQILFTNVESYKGIDIENEGHDHKNENIDVYFDGKNIPFDSETFDSVLTSEVLEHVPNVDECLKEIRRVLKPSGKILLTVPFVWQEHELPFDFRRFLSIGIKKHLIDNGFKILAEEKTGHFLEVVIQLWMNFLRRLFYRNNKYINLILNFLFISPACIIGVFLSWALPKYKDLYFNVILLAEKLRHNEATH